MLVVLETLGPDERAVFILREVFGFDYADIAATVGRPAATVRQIADWAREHMHARRRRLEPVDGAASAAITGAFLQAAASGDTDRLVALLAPDVVWTTDSNGKASAARRPVLGADKVARFVLGLLRAAGPDDRVEPAVYNGASALVLHHGEHTESVITLEIADGRITHFYAMRNPDKLTAVTVQRSISR